MLRVGMRTKGFQPKAPTRNRYQTMGTVTCSFNHPVASSNTPSVKKQVTVPHHIKTRTFTRNGVTLERDAVRLKTLYYRQPSSTSVILLLCVLVGRIHY